MTRRAGANSALSPLLAAPRRGPGLAFLQAALGYAGMGMRTAKVSNFIPPVLRVTACVPLRWAPKYQSHWLRLDSPHFSSL